LHGQFDVLICNAYFATVVSVFVTNKVGTLIFT
jgi:hypothetical protein